MHQRGQSFTARSRHCTTEAIACQLGGIAHIKALGHGVVCRIRIGARKSQLIARRDRRSNGCGVDPGLLTTNTTGGALPCGGIGSWFRSSGIACHC